MKKLMILGSAPIFCYVVDYCREIGIHTVVCDATTNTLVKQRADKSFDVDVMDLDALEAIAREEAVQGIFAASSDILLYAYAHLCARFPSLPCYLTPAQMDVCTNKVVNKVIFAHNGIKTPGFRLLRHCDDLSVLEGLCYPLIVKPADSSGGKGMTIVQEKAQIKTAILNAVSFSIHQNPSVVVEEFIVGREVNIECWIDRGKLYVLSINDKILAEQDPRHPALCLSTRNPSLLMAQKDMLIEAARQVHEAIGMEGGPLTVQTIVRDEDVFVLEPLGRLAGGNTFIILEKLTGINPCKRLVHFALGEPLLSIPDRAYVYSETAECLIIYARAGRVGNVRNLEIIERLPFVLSVERYFDEGTLRTIDVSPFRFAVIHFFAQTPHMLLEREHEILRLVEVRDEEGRDMVINHHTIERLS